MSVWSPALSKLEPVHGWQKRKEDKEEEEEEEGDEETICEFVECNPKEKEEIRKKVNTQLTHFELCGRIKPITVVSPIQCIKNCINALWRLPLVVTPGSMLQAVIM